MTDSTTTSCPVCGTPASGNFCIACGASLGPRACAHCRAELSPQARFCHRCGTAAASSATRGPSTASERRAWGIAAVLCVLLVGGIAYQVSSTTGPATPDMANAGSALGTAGRAPDISAMSPRERFDRLFNRVMQAAGRGDSAEVLRFTPMALGAYQQLDAPDADARYHAAVLHLQVGEVSPARALADTILATTPRHLFGYLIRGEVAAMSGDSRLRARAARDFLAHYASELAAKRVEYSDHQPALDTFKKDAEQAAR